MERLTNITTIYVPVYTNNDLLIQMLSFLTLFTGSSIVGLVPAFISGLVHRLNVIDDDKYVRLVRPKIQLTLILFSTAIVLSQTFSMMNDFKRKTLSPNKTNILNFSFELESVSLILCFPIELLIPPGSSITEKQNSKLLQAHTFGQIERLTDSGFDRMLRSVELRFGATNNTKNLRKKHSDEVLFKTESFNSTWQGKNVTGPVLTRCFRLDLHVKELRYRRMVPFSFLFIRFRNPFWKVFIIGKDQAFHSELTEFRGEFQVSKLVWSYSKRSNKSGCADYREIGCASRSECIDLCVNRRFLEVHHQISTQTTVNKAHFRSFLLPYVTFNETRDPAIEADCRKKFKKPDCSCVRYVENLKPTFRFSKLSIELNLNFDNYLEKDLEYSDLRLALNISTVVCLFFSVNLNSILIQSFSVLKKIFRLRWYKMYGVVIFLICLTGFLVNQFMIFKDITGSENLKDDGHFKKLNEYQMPNSIFCFIFDDKLVDRNFLVTGNYLHSITGDLTYEKIFDRILYWNGTELKTIRLNTTEFWKNDRYSDSEVELSFFFFANLKCFEISLKSFFREVDFVFFRNKDLLQVYFNKNFTEKARGYFTIFLCRQSGSKQFKDIFVYDIGRSASFPDHYHSYQIEFEQLEIERNDQFEFLKRPLSLFYETVALNDVTRYLHEIKQKFTNQYGLISREILVEDERDFALEQNDELFNQFILQKQNRSDHFNPVSYNFRQSVYNSYAQSGIR